MDSKSQLFQVLGFTPTLGQVRVATNTNTRNKKKNPKEFGGAQRRSLGSSMECNAITFQDRKESDEDFHESKRRRNNHSSSHHMHT
jgi:hypothetical protein